MSTEIAQAVRLYTLAYNLNGPPSPNALVYVDFITGEVDGTSSTAEIFTGTAGPQTPTGSRVNRQTGPTISWPAFTATNSQQRDAARTFARMNSLRALVATIAASSGVNPATVG